MDAEVQAEPSLHVQSDEPSPGDPVWLSDDEQRAWRALVAIVVLLPNALDAQLDRDAKLSHFEYATLVLLSEAPNHTLRMSQLAALNDSSLSRLSHVASRLEARGAIVRTTCTEDRRANNATLTPAGLELVVKAAPGHVQRVRELVFDKLSADQVSQLEEIAELIRPELDPENTIPTPAKLVARKRAVSNETIRNGVGGGHASNGLAGNSATSNGVTNHAQQL